MSVPAGYEPHRIIGETVFATDSDSIYFENEDKDEAIELATFSTSSNRAFRMKAEGRIHVKTGSTFQELDLDAMPEFDFKQIL